MLVLWRCGQGSEAEITVTGCGSGLDGPAALPEGLIDVGVDGWREYFRTMSDDQIAALRWRWQRALPWYAAAGWVWGGQSLQRALDAARTVLAERGGG